MTACSLAPLESRAETVETTRAVNNTRTGKSVLELPLSEVLKESPLRAAIDRHLTTALLKGNLTRMRPNKCDVYVKDDGSYGEVGKAAQQVLQGANFKILKTPLAHTDISSLCPNFQRMNEAQKNGFWIWVAAGIEWDETSCGTREMKLRMTPHDRVLIGRLHVPEQKRERSMLGSGCKRNFKR